jgi:hypothetical protein
LTNSSTLYIPAIVCLFRFTDQDHCPNNFFSFLDHNHRFPFVVTWTLFIGDTRDRLRGPVPSRKKISIPDHRRSHCMCNASNGRVDVCVISSWWAASAVGRWIGDQQQEEGIRTFIPHFKRGICGGCVRARGYRWARYRLLHCCIFSMLLDLRSISRFTFYIDGRIPWNAHLMHYSHEKFVRFFLSAHFVPHGHLLWDRTPNIEPLISRWELDKFKNCWNKSFRTSKILTLLYQQF